MLAQLGQHARQLVVASAARLGGQQRAAQPRFVRAALGQQGDQLQVPQLRIVGRVALGLFEHRPGLGMVALVGQHADQARARCGGQRLVAVPGDLARQREAAGLLAQRQQGFHQGVERGFVALVQALRLLEHRPQHRDHLPGLVLLHPEHGRLRQRVRRQRAHAGGAQRLGRGVLDGQGGEHLGVERQADMPKAGAAMLVLAARAAVARIVALDLGQAARAPVVRGQRHRAPQRAGHGAGGARIVHRAAGRRRRAGEPVAKILQAVTAQQAGEHLVDQAAAFGERLDIVCVSHGCRPSGPRCKAARDRALARPALAASPPAPQSAAAPARRGRIRPAARAGARRRCASCGPSSGR